ncbi:hypothetical protein FRX31_025749, partial [Thalictrum thalictroides]
MKEVKWRLSDSISIQEDTDKNRQAANALGHSVQFRNSTPIMLQWLKPHDEEIALNTDGSLTDTSAAIGGIFRTSE